MRIAHISTQRGWGGGEQQASLLVEGLARRGHEPLILARQDGEFAKRMAAAGMTSATFAGGGRSLWAMWQIRRQLALWQPDAVHFHDPHALSGAGLACCRLPIPVRIASRKVSFPIRSGWRYTRFADRVICVSQAVRQSCLASGMPAERLRVVYDGVDPALALSGDRDRGRASLGASPSDLVLLSIGSLTETKGHSYLLAALPAVLSAHPNVRLVLAGDGPLRGTLERQAAELGLGGAVKFLGYRRDVPDLVQAADLFVLPSLAEGMCSTLVDVMLAGRPIVACNVGGVPEVLGAGDWCAEPVGRLVAPRDVSGLAGAICESLAGSADIADRLTRARERALQHFTADRMVEETLALYQEVLAGRLAA
jgi:glycosyltransferase involved in cell wall biosynthesis